jgi:lipopolysaccharide/colanic/teichoic acid biosynthesis glycosyltransferase
MAKRLFDLTLAGLGLALALPLMACVATGIRLASPGPVLYRAVRVGRGGEPFVMYKFRTMHHVPAGTAGPAVTAIQDPRVFPFGCLLRATKLDELPQLWNVLAGDMSIVGPRPEDPGIVAEHYGPLERETLAVRPGLTGPGALFATTNGHLYLNDFDPEGSYVRNLLPVRIGLDLAYARRPSIAQDLRIIGRTLLMIARTVAGIGATGRSRP